MAISERRLVYVVSLIKEGAEPIEVSCRGEYEEDCGTCKRTTALSKEITLTGVHKTQLLNFGKNVVLADIESSEGE